MKKTIVLLLITLFLLLNMFIVPSEAQVMNLKEGLYSVSKLNISPDEIYTIQNISFTDRIQVFIFDENQIIIQSIRLRPQAPKYELQPLQSNYEIGIIGNGEAIITKKAF